MNICFAGEGAIARKHLNAIARIDGVQVDSDKGAQYWSTALEKTLSSERKTINHAKTRT